MSISTLRFGARSMAWGLVTVGLAAVLLSTYARAQPLDSNGDWVAATEDAFADDARTVAVDRYDGPVNLSIYWDNDGFALQRPGGTDRHYTNGMGASVAWRPDWAQGLAEWLPALGERFDFDRPESDARASVGLLIGHEFFTPEEILPFVPRPTDRPYAGYVYAGAFFQRQARTHDDEPRQAVFDHVQLDIGLVGQSSQADKIQREIHRWRDLDFPNGWEAQLTDEPTAQLTWRRKWREPIGSFAVRGLDLDAEVIPQVRARVGTVYIDAEVGVLLRIGHNLPDDFGPNFLRDIGAFTGDASARGWSGYGFVGGSIRAVGHDIFLDGGVFENGPSVNHEALVGVVTLGFATRYAWSDSAYVGVDWGLMFESPAFQNQNNNDGVGFFTLSFRWDF